jgi:DNA-binding transcriptional ArsR family regulator
MDPYEKQAELIKALAHPVRLRILELLTAQEACVCHLTTVLRQRQPYVSQQLMLLREAGLVLDRKESTIVYYRLADQQIEAMIALTRAILQAQGVVVEAPPIPVSPVAGCPCPKCNGTGPCS